MKFTPPNKLLGFTMVAADTDDMSGGTTFTLLAEEFKIDPETGKAVSTLERQYTAYRLSDIQRITARFDVQSAVRQKLIGDLAKAIAAHLAQSFQ